VESIDSLDQLLDSISPIFCFGLKNIQEACAKSLLGVGVTHGNILGYCIRLHHALTNLIWLLSWQLKIWLFAVKEDVFEEVDHLVDYCELNHLQFYSDRVLGGETTGHRILFEIQRHF